MVDVAKTSNGNLLGIAPDQSTNSTDANSGTNALVLCSGGVDSTTLLAMAVAQFGPQNVYALSISYGQKHAKEIESAKAVAAYYGVEQRFLDLAMIFADSNCSLLSHSSEGVPSQSYADQLEQSNGAPVSTYVPFRNGLFLSSAASMALSLGCSLQVSKGLPVCGHGRFGQTW